MWEPQGEKVVEEVEVVDLFYPFRETSVGLLSVAFIGQKALTRSFI